MSNTKEEQIRAYMEQYGATEEEARFLYAYHEADEETQAKIRRYLNVEPAEGGRPCN